jgi:phage major head subunit gpT-like protein
MIVYETWKNSFQITQEMIEDAKIMDMRKQPAAFMTSYERTRELFGAAIYAGWMNKTTSITFRGRSFDIKGADGKGIVATDHPAKVKGAAQSNCFTNAFSADALGLVETAMQNFKGDNGEILDVAPTTILIPNDAGMKKAVFAAIGADKEPTTANNAFNYQYGRWSVIIWPYLNQFITAGSSPWALIDPTYNENYGGAVWNDRVPLTITPDVDKNTDAAIWRGRSRFNATGNDWRFIAVGGIASGTTLS